MPQLPQPSRPFQIVLVVFVLFAGVWLFALQGHSSNSGGTSATETAPAAPVTTASKPAATASKPASSPTAAKHASGSSLGGLSRAINKAQHASAVSQQNANKVAEKSAQASNEPAPAKTSSAATPTPSAAAKAPTASSTTPRPAAKAPVSPAKTPSTSGTAAATTLPAGQRSVEADLAKGNVVVLLFWNPAGADDTTVRRSLQKLADGHSRDVSFHEASASQVATYGSITRGVQVYATPTVLVINKRGQTIVMTGVQDAFAVEQAINEARSS